MLYLHADQLPLKQGLRPLLGIFLVFSLAIHADQLPLKQGLRPTLQMLETKFLTTHADQLPLKQGLRLPPSLTIPLQVSLTQINFH